MNFVAVYGLVLLAFLVGVIVGDWHANPIEGGDGEVKEDRD